jgi:hypothetical protein
MRDLGTVISQILQIIPVEEEDLRYELESWLDRSNSNSIDAWNEVGDILYNFIFCDFYPEIGWQDEVERIWTGDDDSDELINSNF